MEWQRGLDGERRARAKKREQENAQRAAAAADEAEQFAAEGAAEARQWRARVESEREQRRAAAEQVYREREEQLRQERDQCDREEAERRAAFGERQSERRRRRAQMLVCERAGVFCCPLCRPICSLIGRSLLLLARPSGMNATRRWTTRLHATARSSAPRWQRFVLILCCQGLNATF